MAKLTSMIILTTARSSLCFGIHSVANFDGGSALSQRGSVNITRYDRTFCFWVGKQLKNYQFVC